MLTEISISNFKSIEKIEKLKLKPLTILTGVNSSGKSNILEAISFFAQASRISKTSDVTPNPRTIYRYGDMKTYPVLHSIDRMALEDFIMYKKNSHKKATLEINVKPNMFLAENLSNILDSSDEAREHIFPKETFQEIEEVGYSFSFRLSDSSYSQRVLINNKLLAEVRQSRKSGSMIIFPKDFHGSITGHTIDSILVKDVFSSRESHPILDIVLKIAQEIVDYINDQTARIYLISAERGKIDPTYSIKREEDEKSKLPSWIGYNGQHLVKLLSRCLTREPEKSKKIKEWANKFNLSDIRAGYVGKGSLESNFRDSILNSDFNTTLAGFGARQILSIITQIFWSDSGDVIMIEEPEISLHPEHQVRLHELFAEAISQGKQIVCSTHSPFFVLALSRIIEKKGLPIDMIAIYHIEKTKDGTTAKLLKLNKHGFVVSGIPSFMKVEKTLFQDWSESLEEV